MRMMIFKKKGGVGALIIMQHIGRKIEGDRGGTMEGQTGWMEI